MNVFEVTGSLTEEQFHHLPDKIYRHNPNRPSMAGINLQRIFDSRYNSLLQNGAAKRWIVYDEYNLPAGRIAAFYNHHSRKAYGGIGFFESSNDLSLARLLFSTAETWLSQNGCETIEGPVNFGEKDRFWGLMTNGFEEPGIYLDNYNPPYYENLFRSFGFCKCSTSCTYKIIPHHVPVERMEQVVKRLHQKGDYSFRPFNFKKTDMLAKDIHTIYTSAFDAGNRFHHITVTDIIHMILQLKPLMSENHLWMAYLRHEPIGFIAFIKDPKRINGNQEIERLKGFAFALARGFRSKGVELGLCLALYNQLKAEKKLYELYLSGINKNSTIMISFLNKLGAQLSKTHSTFTLKTKQQDATH